MDTTLFLSQLLGVFLTVTGLSIIVKRKMLMHVLEDIFKHRTVSYMFGVLLLIAGLLIVLNHMKWGTTQEIVVSLIGFDLVFESFAYLFLPQKTLKKMFKALRRPWFYRLVSFAYVGLGVYLLTTVI
jgi:uncharacterized membrane protein HdeD (DUF308 family)